MSELHEYLICKIKVETNEKKNQISERKKKKKRKGSMRKIKKNIRKFCSSVLRNANAKSFAI
jgi:hypothetical protein